MHGPEQQVKLLGFASRGSRQQTPGLHGSRTTNREQPEPEGLAQQLLSFLGTEGIAATRELLSLSQHQAGRRAS